MIGTMWLLSKLGMVTAAKLHILSRPCESEDRENYRQYEPHKWGDLGWIRQPGKYGHLDSVDNFGVGSWENDIAPGLAIQNAGTNKMVKTLVPIKIETKWVEAGVSSYQEASWLHGKQWLLCMASSIINCRSTNWGSFLHMIGIRRILWLFRF